MSKDNPEDWELEEWEEDGVRKARLGPLEYQLNSVFENYGKGSSVKDYPAWICLDCGRKWGRHRPTHEITMHEDICGICGEKAICTEPRDFGHLKDGWEYEQHT